MDSWWLEITESTILLLVGNILIWHLWSEEQHQKFAFFLPPYEQHTGDAHSLLLPLRRIARFANLRNLQIVLLALQYPYVPVYRYIIQVVYLYCTCTYLTQYILRGHAIHARYKYCTRTVLVLRSTTCTGDVRYIRVYTGTVLVPYAVLYFHLPYEQTQSPSVLSGLQYKYCSMWFWEDNTDCNKGPDAYQDLARGLGFLLYISTTCSLDKLCTGGVCTDNLA